MPWIKTYIFCLQILAEYRVVPMKIRLLWMYWDRLTMVAKANGYFGPPFKGYHGINQGEPLSPTLFNLVMDAVIHHWVTVVAPTVDGLEVWDLSLGELVSYFYANNGLVVSTQPERRHRAVYALTGIFVWVILRTNMMKTLSMAWNDIHDMRLD